MYVAFGYEAQVAVGLVKQIREDMGLLSIGDGDQVVPVVNPKCFPQAVEDVGAVVFPLEGRELSTGRDMLNNLQANAVSLLLALTFLTCALHAVIT